MKAIRTMHSPLWKHVSSIAVLLALIAASLTTVGCMIRFIGDYDDVIDKGVTDLQQRTEVYLAKVQANPPAPFDQSFYDDVNARMKVLKTRAALQTKYKIISEQLDLLQKNFDLLQQLDQKRPFPPGAVQSADDGIVRSVEAIEKLQLALKQRGAPSK